MNRVLFPGCLLLLLFSCKKSSTDPGTDFEYNLNGAVVHIQNGRDTLHHNADSGADLGAYTLVYDTASYCMTFGVNRDNGLNFGMDIRALRLGLSNAFGLGMRLTAAGTAYGLYDTGRDSMVVHLTRYSNGTFDGTFYGSVSDSTQTKTAVITRGVFLNIKAYIQ